MPLSEKVSWGSLSETEKEEIMSRLLEELERPKADRLYELFGQLRSRTD